MKRTIFNQYLRVLKLRNNLNKDIFINWVSDELTLSQHLKVHTLLKENNYRPIDKSRYGSPDTLARNNYIALDIILPQDTYTKEQPRH